MGRSGVGESENGTRRGNVGGEWTERTRRKDAAERGGGERERLSKATRGKAN